MRSLLAFWRKVWGAQLGTISGILAGNMSVKGRQPQGEPGKLGARWIRAGKSLLRTGGLLVDLDGKNLPQSQ